MTEQERTHCRVDLHRIEFGSMSPADFISRYGPRLDAVLLEPPADDQTDIEDLNKHTSELEADLINAITDAATKGTAIWAAIGKLKDFAGAHADYEPELFDILSGLEAAV